jgi:hypothetical protein
MIRHTVVFNLVHPAGSGEEAEFLDAGRRVLTGVPGVEAFSIARQVSSQTQFAFQFSMDFRDQAEYDAYSAHEDHTQFVETRWKNEVAEFCEFDFVPYGVPPQ